MSKAIHVIPPEVRIELDKDELRTGHSFVRVTTDKEGNKTYERVDPMKIILDHLTETAD